MRSRCVIARVVVVLAVCAPTACSTGDNASKDAATDVRPTATELTAASHSVAAAPTPLTPVVPVTPADPPVANTPRAPQASAATSAPVSLPAPYIASARWASSPYGRSLQVTPTPNGRNTAGVQDGQLAWAEVLQRAPDGNSPGMWEQFVCHWNFARAVQPDKPTWNLEPWRPEVDDLAMIASRCNPGGPEV